MNSLIFLALEEARGRPSREASLSASYMLSISEGEAAGGSSGKEPLQFEETRDLG